MRENDEIFFLYPCDICSERFRRRVGHQSPQENVGQYCVGVEDVERKTKIFVEAEVKHSENELVARAWARKHYYSDITFKDICCTKQILSVVGGGGCKAA